MEEGERGGVRVSEGKCDNRVVANSTRRARFPLCSFFPFLSFLFFISSLFFPLPSSLFVLPSSLKKPPAIRGEMELEA